MVSEIRVCVEVVPDSESVKAVLGEFTDETGIRVELDEMPYLSMYDRLVPQLLLSRSRYDVVQVDCTWSTEFSQEGLLFPLDDYLDKSELSLDDFHPCVVNVSGRFEGSTYQIPDYHYVMGLLYRTDLVGDGDDRTKAIPETLPELSALASSLTSPDAGAWGTCGVGEVIENVYDWINYVLAAGVELSDASLYEALRDSRAVEATEVWLRMLRECSPPDDVFRTYDTMVEVFEQGAIGFVISFAWLADIWNRPGQPLAGRVAFAPLPSGGFLGSWGWSMSRGAQDKEAAWRFIEWISSRAVVERRLEYGHAPVRRDIYGDAALRARHPLLPAYQAALDKAVPFPSQLRWWDAVRLLSWELVEATAGRATPATALQNAADGLQRLAEQRSTLEVLH